MYDVFTQFSYTNDWWILVRNFTDEDRPYGYLDREHFTDIPMFTLIHYRRANMGAPWKYYIHSPNQSLDLALDYVKRLANDFLGGALRTIKDLRRDEEMGIRIRKR